MPSQVCASCQEPLPGGCAHPLNPSAHVTLVRTSW
ncbi:uncharacterized protein FPRN_04182 [Fusarium proliferatum]|nr:uncharacterized protein FPRN_04182 [Fusarium proliferatum]